MWADAHRDGHPAIARVLCSNAANIAERKSWMQSELCTWQNSVTGQEPPKMYTRYIVYQPTR